MVDTVPPGVLGGVTTALDGLIGVVGIADDTVSFDDLFFNGIALGTIVAIVVLHAMSALTRVRRPG